MINQLLNEKSKIVQLFIAAPKALPYLNSVACLTQPLFGKEGSCFEGAQDFGAQYGTVELVNILRT